MNLGNFMGNMFGRVEPGLCRLSMNGQVAIKTDSDNYKTYNIKTRRLVNCSNFVFDIGQDFFFVIPTNKVECGDIILVDGTPRCVVEVGKDDITVINYKTSVRETIIPERHVFMGSTYFYGKIVSVFGNGFKAGKKKGVNNILKYMVMSEMMKGAGNSLGSNNPNGFNPMMLMMMSGGGMGDMFEGLFDIDTDIEDTEDDESEVDE